MANSTEGKPLPPFLESSYLKNKRVFFKPGDTVKVGLCREGGPCCSNQDGTCQAREGSVKLEEGLSKDNLLAALKVLSLCNSLLACSPCWIMS